MELTGQIIEVLPEKSGTSARGPWRKREYVIEIPGDYPKKVCFMVWGDKIDQLNIKEGENLTVRQRNRLELNALIEEWLATLPSDDAAIAILEASRVPCARVIAPYEAMDHPHYESRQMARAVPDPVMGEVVVPGNPIRDSDVPLPRDMDAPLLGEHNTEILQSLGYTAADVARLEGAGVLGRADT